MTARPSESPDFTQHLVKALAAVATMFWPNELAYLALTSKVEGPIRDRLAFKLHEALSPTGRFVAREFRRIAIAVIHEDKVCALIELKAMYTFDALDDDRYLARLDRDVSKCHEQGCEGAQVFTVLLATHPH